MKQIILILLALALLPGCDRSRESSDAPVETAAPAETAGPAISGIDVQYMDPSVRPGDDFFTYVNGAWLEETEIPPDRASHGVFSLLSDKAQEDVRAIIEASAAGDFPAGSDEQKIGDLYSSWLDMEQRNQTGLAPLQRKWREIDAIGDYDQLAVYFAAAGRRGYDMPFGFDQYVDLKQPDTYMILTWQGGLGLPDREYYFNEDEKSAEIRSQYQAHVAAMLGLAEYPEPSEAAQLIMALESRMAAEHMLKEDTRDWTRLYNKHTPPDLAELMPAFNWSGYMQALDLPAIDGIVITQVDHMQAMDGIITDTPLADWKVWLKWAVLNGAASQLNDALDRQNFEFYGKVLSGREEQRPMWRRGVNTVNSVLGEVVGRVYVKKHFPPEARERMLALVDNLIRAYRVSIEALDWMTEPTRAEALDKLSRFTPKIGYPDKWRDYSALSIAADDLFGNLERAALAEWERKIKRQNDPVDRGEWYMTPQTVNAYYNPPLNEIVFPAAILQPPFFNMAADDAVNYGAIGAVIGHEIGHGFDDSGSRFDGKGVLRNWWTDDDRQAFEARTEKLIAQYNEFRPFEDLAVNGEYTLGENIGDLGGISIGLLAYQLSLDGKPAPVIDGFTGVQRVFLGYGQAWRSKAREEAIRRQIATDPHSPARYRANGAVRNVPAFYEAFAVRDTDALYLPPADRVKIW